MVKRSSQLLRGSSLNLGLKQTSFNLLPDGNFVGRFHVCRLCIPQTNFFQDFLVKEWTEQVSKIEASGNGGGGVLKEKIRPRSRKNGLW